MKQVSRYHPLLATLHWVLAVLIIGQLSVGFFGLAATRNSDPRKIGILRLHMEGGVLILALMVIRFIVRLRTLRSSNATSGYPFLGRIARVSHYGFYILVLLMVGTGFATAILSGLNMIVFGPPGAPLPPTLMIYRSWVAYGYIAVLLAGLIGLHMIGVLYHQFVRKDGLLRRMLLGQRVTDADRYTG